MRFNFWSLSSYYFPTTIVSLYTIFDLCFATLATTLSHDVVSVIPIPTRLYMISGFSNSKCKMMASPHPILRSRGFLMNHDVIDLDKETGPTSLVSLPLLVKTTCHDSHLWSTLTSLFTTWMNLDPKCQHPIHDFANPWNFYGKIPDLNITQALGSVTIYFNGYMFYSSYQRISFI